MDVLILLIFVSMMLVGSAIGFFAWNLHRKNHHHLDRLSLMPLDQRGETHRMAGTEANPCDPIDS